MPRVPGWWEMAAGEAMTCRSWGVAGVWLIGEWTGGHCLVLLAQPHVLPSPTELHLRDDYAGSAVLPRPPTSTALHCPVLPSLASLYCLTSTGNSLATSCGH